MRDTSDKRERTLLTGLSATLALTAASLVFSREEIPPPAEPTESKSEMRGQPREISPSPIQRELVRESVPSPKTTAPLIPSMATHETSNNPRATLESSDLFALEQEDFSSTLTSLRIDELNFEISLSDEGISIGGTIAF